jgi:hypothetical protein
MIVRDQLNRIEIAKEAAFAKSLLTEILKGMS